MLIRIWNIFGLKVKVGIIAALLLLAGTLVHTLPTGSSRLTETMKAGGFTLSQHEDINTRPGKVTLNGISLDTDGFSMIGKLEATGNPFFPLTGTPKRLDISNMQITGEWNEELGLSFAGWSLPHGDTASWSKIERIVLGKSIIDLDTPAGALRLELEGESARHPERPDQQIFNFHLSGTQHQLILDSQIKGTWSAAQGLTLENEIREARINTKNITASRVTGWITLETQSDNSLVPTLSGQMQAGQFARDNLKLGNVSLTLDGPLTAPHALINAQINGYESASLLLELQAKDDGTHILANIETRTLDDLLSILAEFRTQAETSPVLQESLMSLLLTEGNIDRVKQDLKKGQYESFALELEGLSHDLNGKIIGKKMKDGVMQRQVFSLNPSIAAGGN